MTRYRNHFATNRAALDRMAEEQSWSCDCGTVLEEGQARLCRSCEAYSEDMAADLLRDETWLFGELDR